MLLELHVKNLALIEKADVEFGEGLNILTGETGAGKSIIIGSVTMALGGKASKDVIRRGADHAYIELIFFVDSKEKKKALMQLGTEPTEEGMVIISRKIMPSRSVSRINDETVTMARLRQITGLLLDIHGQHEHQSLLYKKNQLQILDAFGGKKIQELSADVKTAYKTYRDSKKEWERANLDEGERAKEVSFLEFEIQEIRAAELIPGEDERLEADYKRMNSARNILENASEAYECTGGMSGDNASDMISRAIRCMIDASRYDDKAAELSEQLVELDGLLNDFNRELAEYQSSLEFSDEEYHETEERLDTINHMKTRYGNTIPEILAYCEEKEERLQKLQDYDSYLAQLQKELKQRRQELEAAIHNKNLLEQRKKLVERRERSHRLIVKGAEFEKAFPLSRDLEQEEFQEIMNQMRNSSYNKSVVRQNYIAASQKDRQEIAEAVKKTEKGDDS